MRTTVMTAGTEHEQLLELLQICEDYFRHTDPTTHAELDTVLRRHHITGGPGWLIDMLSLTLHRLHHEHATSTGESNTRNDR
jgi:hypothetical protein